MSHPDALVAVLDANVLYPQWLRDMMLTLAAMGYYDPVWSWQIIDEMRRNVLADHPDIDPRRFEEATIGALRRAFPDAWVEVPDALIAEMDNAPGDRHVLAAAVRGLVGRQQRAVHDDAHARCRRGVRSCPRDRPVGAGQIEGDPTRWRPSTAAAGRRAIRKTTA